MRQQSGGVKQKNTKAKKSFSTLAERLKKIRKRHLSQKQIKELNNIFKKIDHEQQTPTIN